MSSFVLLSGMSWAAWSFWWQKITWSFTWTEELLAGRCLESAGWRDAIRWLTGSRWKKEKKRKDKDEMHVPLSPTTTECLPQTEEEPQVSHHRSPNLVHPHGPGDLQTFYKVRNSSNNSFKITSFIILIIHIFKYSLAVVWCPPALHTMFVFRVSFSVKFMDKIRYVHTLAELANIIPMEHVQIPECVLQ